MDELIRQADRIRLERGFLCLNDLVELADTGNVIYDPWSTLISARAELGQNNVFYPNTMIEVSDEGAVKIGDGNVFFTGTILASAANGKLAIGNENEIGEGGFVARANRQDSVVQVGSWGRYLNGAQVMGRTTLGDGCQILGPITVQNCNLEGGESYRHPDPDARGALLKGSGLARDLKVERGWVINGSGRFLQEQAERQSSYH